MLPVIACECSCPLPPACYCPDLLGVELELDDGEILEIARPAHMPCSWSFSSTFYVPLLMTSYTSGWAFYRWKQRAAGGTHDRWNWYQQTRLSQTYDYQLQVRLSGAVQLGIYDPTKVSVLLKIQTQLWGTISPVSFENETQFQETTGYYGCVVGSGPQICESGEGTSTPYSFDPGPCGVDTTTGDFGTRLLTIEQTHRGQHLCGANIVGPTWYSGYQSQPAIEFACEEEVTVENPTGATCEEYDVEYKVTRFDFCDFQPIEMDLFTHTIPIPLDWQLNNITARGYYA